MTVSKNFTLFGIFTCITLLISCNTEPPVKVTPFYVYANGESRSDFFPSDSIEISASLPTSTAEYTFYFKENNGAYVRAEGNTMTFGPYSAKSRITISVKAVTSTGGEQVKSIDLNIGTPVEWNGALHVDGTSLVNENGNAIQLRGLSTHGLQYFDEFYTENAIKAAARLWGADIIRISSYVNEGWPDYLESPEYWKARIDTLVSYAINAGIYVLIDWHQLVPGDPNDNLTEAKDFFSYMVDAHGTKPNVLFDICNEPNNDSIGHYYPETEEYITYQYKTPVTWAKIKAYANEIIPIIRAKSDNVIIVGTPQWASRPDLVIGNKLEFENIMYTMHFYAADHKDGYRNNVESAIKAGIPVFVTEFGTQNADGEGTNDFESSAEWLTLLQKYKISWCNWNYSDDFRSGAVFIKDSYFSTVESYADTAKIKEAGLWIKNNLIIPADEF